MSGGLSRAEFLRGHFLKRAGQQRLARLHMSLIRPPGAIPEAQFMALCDGCGKCVSACPSKIISLDAEQKAQLNFGPAPMPSEAGPSEAGPSEAGPSEAGCIFCDACNDVCPTKALNANEARSWLVKAQLKPDACLSLRGIVCRTCDDVCESRAISFKLMTMGHARPAIAAQVCTGCGACAALCPGKAIDLGEMALSELSAATSPPAAPSPARKAPS